ncbi:MAG TPA: peptidoglycan-binding protein, partial [Polyangiaceae bacterium]|nr:peptidoglycan-binding protein [Polyangiaceae bacterium]
RSRSTPQGTQVNGNEIRFEDMKGREDLFVQAEKTQTTVVKDSQFVNVGVNRSMTVGAAETVTIGLTRALQVGAASSTTVGGDSSETVGGVRRVTVGGQGITTIAQSAVLDVGGDSLTRVTGVTRFDLAGPLRVSTAGDESRTTGGALDVRVGDKASYVYAAESKSVVGHPDRKASLSSFVYGTSSSATSDDLTIESDTSIVLKCGDTKVVITPDGVTIEGKTLEWKAGSKLAVTSPSASLTLDDDVAAIGTKVSIASSGAELALDSAAKLTGAKVQLGSGSGASASASSQSQQADADKKPVYIRTRILRSGEPAAGVAYTLVLDGKLTLSGSTTGDGLVEQEVPATVSAAELTLLDTGETHSFTINAIERVDTMLGAQQRLQRLGYYHGAVDGTQGPLTAHALAAFQKAQGLDASGELDGATQAALKKAYGS